MKTRPTYEEFLQMVLEMRLQQLEYFRRRTKRARMMADHRAYIVDQVLLLIMPVTAKELQIVEYDPED